MEFSKSTTIDESGTTQINITVKVKVDVSPEISVGLAEQYKNAAIDQFSQVVGSVYDPERNVQYSGTLEFSDDATIHLSILEHAYKANEDELVPTGYAAPGFLGVSTGLNIGENENSFSPSKFGLIVVHELFHQGGVEHPTSPGAVEDARLIRRPIPSISNSFNSTFFTTPEIYENVMLYDFYTVNDKLVRDVRGSDENANKATPGQLNEVSENIDNGLVNGEALLENEQ